MAETTGKKRQASQLERRSDVTSAFSLASLRHLLHNYGIVAFLLLVVRKAKWLLAGFVTVYLCEATILAIGYSHGGYEHPICNGFEYAGEFLLTLGSPPQRVPISNDVLMIGRILGWVVSLVGWLAFPTLIGISLSRAQAADQQSREEAYGMEKLLETVVASPEERAKFIEQLLNFVEHARPVEPSNGKEKI